MGARLCPVLTMVVGVRLCVYVCGVGYGGEENEVICGALCGCLDDYWCFVAGN